MFGYQPFKILPGDIIIFLVSVDGQVRLKTDTFRLFLGKQIDKRKFYLHDEQTVNGFLKIAWVSIFYLKQQHTHIYDYIYIYIYIYI
jgi:hypothetical protein